MPPQRALRAVSPILRAFEVGYRMEAVGFHNLVRQAQDGDRQAMDEVLVALRPQLERLARPYADPSRPAESTSDLLQESCLRAWQKMDTFEGGHDDGETFAMFRAWIGQIVRRLGVKAQRARTTKRRSPPKKILRLGPSSDGRGTTTSGGLDPAAPGPSPSAYARSDELESKIRAALEEEPDRTAATIVELRFFQEMRISEIAERLGMGYDKVRDCYRAAMQRLVRDLKGWL